MFAIFFSRRFARSLFSYIYISIIDRQIDISIKDDWDENVCAIPMTRANGIRHKFDIVRIYKIYIYIVYDGKKKH